MRRVLITGSAGHIGQHLVRTLRSHYEIRGFDREPTPGLEDAVVGDLGDRDALLRAAREADVVVHLAGNRGANAGWDEILHSNIIGTYNVFDAAREAGVAKIVYASTCQVTFGYGEHARQGPDMYPRSLSYYAVSKVTGEQLGHLYSNRHAIDVICLRLGLFTSTGLVPATRQLTGRFIGREDTTRLFRRAIEAIGVRFAVVYGASDSSLLSFDLESAREILGYVPIQREDDHLQKSED